jgi:peptidyl-prolyl cis-trans isomerase D
MAIIGKIRSYSKLVVIIVGVALAAFVLGDFIKKGPKRGQVDFAKVAGEKINYQDFEARVEQYTDMMKKQAGKENFTASEIYTFRDDVWKKMVKDIIMQKEYDELGLTVSTEEISDLVFGKNPHQQILQNFTDPQTGQFNPQNVVDFKNMIDQGKATPEQQNSWNELLISIKEDRLNTKYNNLITHGYYLPQKLLKHEYEQRNRIAHFRFVAEKYNTISDSTLKVSEEDLKKYYEDHKHEYVIDEATRDLIFVTFDVLPSNEDVEKVHKDILKLKDEMTTTEDIAAFVNGNTDAEGKYDSTYHKAGTLPMFLDTMVYKKEKGTIFGPILDNQSYYIAKLLDKQMRPDSMKASHILIAYLNDYTQGSNITRTKDQAKKTADSLLEVIKKDDKKFAAMAGQFSDAQSKKKGGDLDWFEDGKMPGAINEACVKGKVGDKLVVETPEGFHVLYITDKKKPVQKVQVAVVQRMIEPSQQTRNTVYAKVTAFRGNVNTIEAFEKSAKNSGYNIRTAENIKEMDNKIAGLESPREIVRWAYDEKTEKGNVSKIFDVEQTKYVVAALKDIKEKGTLPFEQMKTYIEPLAKREKKAEILIKKIKAAQTPGISIDQLASKLNTKIDTLDFITYSSYSVPGFGPEPVVIGTLFTLKKGVLSEPIKGANGVFALYIDDFVEAPPAKDYNSLRSQIMGYFVQRTNYDLYNVLERAANVTDNRGKFY